MDRYRQLVGVLLLLLSGALSADEASLKQQLVQALQQGQLLPTLSSQESGLDSDMAYRLQSALLAAQPERAVIGYKAALMHKLAQEKFGSDGPVMGVLLGPERFESGVKLKLSDYHRLFMELELGFTFREPIIAPISSIEVLQARVATVRPVVELPDLYFADLKSVKWLDIIAANVSARAVIEGKPLPIEQLDVNGVTVALSKNGERVKEVNSRMVLGDQWLALLWLVNKTIALGYTISSDQLLITGAMGGMSPVGAGHYYADYGDLGTISFQVE